jgi:hypothetical protein
MVRSVTSGLAATTVISGSPFPHPAKLWSLAIQLLHESPAAPRKSSDTVKSNSLRLVFFRRMKLQGPNCSDASFAGCNQLC